VTDCPRFLLIRLEPDLHASRIAGVWAALRLLPGVLCVFEADLTRLPSERLDVLTSGPELKVRQGELPLVELSA
jgi:hypothetical protein